MGDDNQIKAFQVYMLQQWMNRGHEGIPPFTDRAFEMVYSSKDKRKAVEVALDEAERLIAIAEEIDSTKASNYDKLQTYRNLFQKFFDEFFQSSTYQLTCKDKCSACCYIPVSTNIREMMAIKTKTDWSNIDMSLVKKQMHFADPDKFVEKIPWTDRKCVFLKDNSCSIYDERPMACRRHNSVTPVELCDTSTGLHQVGSVYHITSEIWYAIFATRWGDKRMSKTIYDIVVKR